MAESPNGETRGSAELERLGTVEVLFWEGRCKGEMSGPPGSVEDKLDFGPLDELSKKVGFNGGRLAIHRHDLADHGIGQMIGHTVGAGESTLVEAPTTSLGFAKNNPFKADYRVVFQGGHLPRLKRNETDRRRSTERGVC